MSSSSQMKPAFKVWLETEEGYVFGPGVYSLLKKIRERGTLKEAAESLGMSYRFAWGLLKKAEEKMGESLVTSHKGGKLGGGGFNITEVGIRFLREFSEIERAMQIHSKEYELTKEFESTKTVRTKILEMTQKNDDMIITFQSEDFNILKFKLAKDTLKDLDLSVGDTASLEIKSNITKLTKI